MIRVQRGRKEEKRGRKTRDGMHSLQTKIFPNKCLLFGMDKDFHIVVLIAACVLISAFVPSNVQE
jgi:hypothetical protein